MLTFLYNSGEKSIAGNIIFQVYIEINVVQLKPNVRNKQRNWNIMELISVILLFLLTVCLRNIGSDVDRWLRLFMSRNPISINKLLILFFHTCVCDLNTAIIFRITDFDYKIKAYCGNRESRIMSQ